MRLGPVLGEEVHKMLYFLDLFRREMAELFKQACSYTLVINGCPCRDHLTTLAAKDQLLKPNQTDTALSRPPVRYGILVQLAGRFFRQRTGFSSLI